MTNPARLKVVPSQTESHNVGDWVVHTASLSALSSMPPVSVEETSLLCLWVWTLSLPVRAGVLSQEVSSVDSGLPVSPLSLVHGPGFIPTPPGATGEKEPHVSYFRVSTSTQHIVGDKNNIIFRAKMYR